MEITRFHGIISLRVNMFSSWRKGKHVLHNVVIFDLDHCSCLSADIILLYVKWFLTRVTKWKLELKVSIYLICFLGSVFPSIKHPTRPKYFTCARHTHILFIQTQSRILLPHLQFVRAIIYTSDRYFWQSF
jgi:hypothetical protein